MAKSASEREAKKRSSDGKGAKASPKSEPSGPLAAAQEALVRGDVKTARSELNKLAADPASADSARAAEISKRLGVDPQALATAIIVLVVIALAATFALFTRHG